jgi:hypothetical protein
MITFKEFLIFLSWVIWFLGNLAVLTSVTFIQNGDITSPDLDFFFRMVGFVTVYSGIHLFIITNCLMKRIEKEYGHN